MYVIIYHIQRIAKLCQEIEDKSSFFFTTLNRSLKLVIPSFRLAFKND